jgi:hypothetical protein
MTEWLDIESAPKTHPILGYCKRQDGSGYIDRIWWDDYFEQTGWNEELEQVYYRGAWSAGRVASWGYEEYAEEFPTHWMPLPDPPSV